MNLALTRLVLLSVLLLAVGVPAVRAQAPGRDTPLPAPTEEPTDTDEPLEIAPPIEGLADEIEALIRKLAAVDYRQREEATERLSEIGAPAIPALHAAYRSTRDAEVRLRIERIVYKAYFDFHIYSRKGFLGISLTAYEPDRQEAGFPLVSGPTAVRITKVIEGTAAFRAGLQPDDIIVAMNDRPLAVDAEAVTEGRLRRTQPEVIAFSRAIAAHHPDETVTFKLVRGGEPRTVEAVLGFVPEDIAQSGTVTAVNEALPTVRRNFALWWHKYFHQPER